MCLLKIDSLTKNYGDKKGLFNFSMELNSGDIVGLIGVNGAGKTTLLNMISGNTLPDSGELFYKENKMEIDSSYRKNFGISVNPGFYDYMNTYENLRSILFLNEEKDKNEIDEKIRNVLNVVGLNNVEGKKIKEFSFGMKQRLGFAQAILNTKSIMLLDEPFVGLDINGRSMVKEYIKKMVANKNLAVIFSDHNLDEVKSLCNRLIVIRGGEKIYDGDLDIKSSVLIKVKSTIDLDENYVEILDDFTVKVSNQNLNKKLEYIAKVTEIIKIERIINPLEKMLEVRTDAKNNKI